MCDQFLDGTLGLWDINETQNLAIWTKNWGFPVVFTFVTNIKISREFMKRTFPAESALRRCFLK